MVVSYPVWHGQLKEIDQFNHDRPDQRLSIGHQPATRHCPSFAWFCGFYNEAYYVVIYLVPCSRIGFSPGEEGADQYTSQVHLSQFMRLWYLSHRRPSKAQVSLRIRAVSPEPSLFAHTKYGSRRRVRPKFRHLAPLDGCACAFEERVYGGRKVP